MTSATVTAVPRRLAPLVEGLPKTYWALWLGSLVNRAGSFVMPMLTIYLTQSRKLPLPEAGAIVALYGLGSLGGSTLGGVLADHLGRRTTLLLALVLGATFMLALGFSTTVPQLVASVILLGLTTDMFRPAMWAAVADVVEPAYRLKAFGHLYWAINLGFSLASVIAGFMASVNFTLLFIGDAATTLIFAGVVWFAVPETKPERSAHGDQGSFFTPFLDLRYLPFLLINVLLALIFFQHLTALPADMLAKGLGPKDFGLAVSLNGVLIVLFQPTLTRWLTGISRAKLLAVATALTGVGFGLTMFATALPLYMATVAVWTFGEIIMAPVNASVVADLSPAQMRGRYQGAFNLTWSLSSLLAPLIGPFVMAKAGAPALWVGCAVAGLAATAVHLTVSRRLIDAAPPRGGGW